MIEILLALIAGLKSMFENLFCFSTCCSNTYYFDDDSDSDEDVFFDYKQRRRPKSI